jgi:hypothetical protein
MESNLKQHQKIYRECEKEGRGKTEKDGGTTPPMVHQKKIPRCFSSKNGFVKKGM